MDRSLAGALKKIVAPIVVRPIIETVSSRELGTPLVGIMGNENRYARLFEAARQGARLALARYFILLPPCPRPNTLRSRLADGLFKFLLLMSRCTVVTGAILCGSYAKTNGFKWFVIGLLVGWAVGFWIRLSLGMRAWDRTYGFYDRLLERGNGAPPKLLESLVEKLRGSEFTPSQCRMVAGAYAEMQRQLHLCDSRAERRKLFDALERKALGILYGEPPVAFHREAESALPAGNGPVPEPNAGGHSGALHAPAAVPNH
jgi:hypothetical protein